MTLPYTILVVEDTDAHREYMSGVLTAAGYEVLTATGVAAGRELIERHSLDMAFLDLNLPPGNGRELLSLLQEVSPDVPAVIVTAEDAAAPAVELMRRGVLNYLVKPVNAEDLLRHATQGVELCRTRRALVNWRDVVDRSGRSWYVGETPRMKATETLVAKCARTPTSVLIQGESGTGKEVVARALHGKSQRAAGPFIAINCAALPEHLLESELFGHERGAFTGAVAQRRGMLELADGGTLFLDELTSMTPEMQAKLLRALQEFQFRRVGGSRELKVDVRVISASNRNVVEAIRAGAFREDLFYRLCVVTLDLPPLRDRRADVPHFVAEFLTEFRSEMGSSVTRVADSAMWALTEYAWPGNIRELRNVIERAVIVASGADCIEVGDLPEFVRAAAVPAPVPGLTDDMGLPRHLPEAGVDLKDLMATWERGMIEQALARTGNNQSAAARYLGLTRDELRYRVEKYGLPT